ncbi:hypothetical protein HPP92_013650 [Vanilla planifolia]|uniref:Uncharacterized protein n=2 Tax=Vanilla planifolia TaxID=51239 RepID=A0A835QQF8_VANPL|nr:hypothetical protein HPP92_013650 [Vanilla planifolia]
MPVAVKLCTTRPTAYSFSPGFVALLTPLSSALFTLVLRPTETPPLVFPPDCLLVSSALAPALRRANSAAIRQLFSRPGLQLFRDASLPIHLLCPKALRSIVLCLPSSASSFLRRLIPSCSPADLSSALPLAAQLHVVGGSGTVSILLAAGADPDARSADGKSAISLAVSAGNAEAVEALMIAGARDRPLHEAAAINRVDIILLLLGPGQPNWADTMDAEGRTPVHSAAVAGALDALFLCLSCGGDPNRGDVRGWTPLHFAAYGGHLSVAELLIKASPFDPRHVLTRGGRGRSRRTPLELALEQGHAELLELLRPRGEVIRAARSGDVATAIRAGGMIHERDQYGWTALHVAASKGRVDAVMELVERGAEVDVEDNDGYTPLRCAMEFGHTELALLLVGCGARAGLKNLLKAKDSSTGVGAAAKALKSFAAAVSAAVMEIGVGGDVKMTGMETAMKVSAGII